MVRHIIPAIILQQAKTVKIFLRNRARLLHLRTDEDYVKNSATFFLEENKAKEKQLYKSVYHNG